MRRRDIGLDLVFMMLYTDFKGFGLYSCFFYKFTSTCFIFRGFGMVWTH